MSGLKTLGEQFVKFGIVGLSNTLISLAVYYIFIFINKDLYLAGSIAGFFISVLNSYYWNNRYVFRTEKRNHLKALGKTYLSYGITSALSILLLIFLIEILKVPETVAPIINLAITIPLNFLLNKFWAFK